MIIPFGLNDSKTNMLQILGEMLQTTVVYRCTLCNNDRKQYSNEISLLEHQCTECELNNMRLLDLFADVRQLTRRTIVQIPVTETNGLQFLPAQSLKLRMVTGKQSITFINLIFSISTVIVSLLIYLILQQ